MLYKKALLFFLILVSGCTGHQYQQQDARYTGGALSAPANGQVLVRASTHYQRSKLHQLIWGKHYRQVWAAPVPVPVLNLQALPTTLTPIKLGGGLQTTSLSFSDPDGRTFTLRTLEKDPSKSLPPRLQHTLVSQIMRDQTSAINPYAFLTIPPLAEAVGVFHTNPALYYVPANIQGLGEYSDQFAGKLTMLEEKFENKIDLSPAFGPVAEVTDTEELFKRLQKSNDHQVDQVEMARARLLDVIIRDWDRHEGQWTWAKYHTEQGMHLYKPLPKDRDYAFYRYADGALTWLLSRRLLFGKVKPFIHNIPDVKGLVYKGRALDKKMLNKLTIEEWTRIATDMQAALTDEILQNALRQLPDTVYKLEGEKTYRHLKKQVNQLPKTAQEFYRILAREVTVKGSDEKEKFVINRLPDKTTLVQVFALSNTPGEEPQRLYHRVFKPQETKKIFLNGLGSADEYIITGKARKGPKIYLHVQPKKDTVLGKEGARKIVILEKEPGNKKAD